MYLTNVIYTPNCVLKEVKDIIVDFIWDGKPSKIAYDVLVKNIEDGGLKMVDLESKVKSFNINWVKRFTLNKEGNWKKAPAYFYQEKDLVFHFECNKPPVKCPVKLYNEIHKHWLELKKVDKEDNTYIRNQIIWKNKCVTINKKPFFWTQWYENGIKRINDIVNEEGTFFTHEELSLRYNINCNFLNALQIRQSIPHVWRKSLCSNEKYTLSDEVFISLDNKNYCISDISSKLCYWYFVNQKRRDPTCIQRWTEVYPNLKDGDPNLWSCVFKLSFSICRETKLQSFQYRLLHRLITCHEKLYEMKLVKDPRCEFCGELDNLKHFFLFCNNVNAFWDSLFRWWNRMSDTQISPDFDELEESILFGFHAKGEIFIVLNYCILLAKYYIYRQRIHNGNCIQFYDFLVELKYKLSLEKNICTINGTSQLFDKFIFIYNNL